MCGICGITVIDKPLMKKMLSSMISRGPDNEGIFDDDLIVLGHRRLSIIDLTKAGSQPLCNEDETIWVTFNGEIYNYKTLRTDLINKGHTFKSSTDTEVLVHGYEEWGKSLLNHIEGEFAFAIHDRVKKVVFLARDRLGTKPLYYCKHDGEFAFASQLTTLLLFKKRTINKLSTQLFCRQRCVFGKETIVDDIFRLLPGEYIELDLLSKKFKKEVYFNVMSKEDNSSKNSAVKKLHSLLKESCENRLQSDVPVGSYLSGGLDSSIITSIIAKQKEDLQTFSISFQGAGEVSEESHARRVSEELGTNHRHFEIDRDFMKEFPKIMQSCDEPLADTAIIPTYFLGRETAKKGVKVVLTGDGADEIFAGYEQYKILLLKKRVPFSRFAYLAKPPLRITPLSLLSKVHPFIPKMGKEFVNQLLDVMSEKDPSLAYMKITNLFTDKQIERLIPDLKAQEHFKEYFNKELDSIKSAMITDQKTILPEDYLMKVDKMSMAHSIEPRVPFLDYRIVKLANSMPTSWKLDLFNTKKILKETFKKEIPSENRKRKKQRFYVPIEKWLSKDPELLEQARSSSELKFLFDKEELKKVVSKPKNLYHARQAWTAISLHQWIEANKSNLLFQ